MAFYTFNTNTNKLSPHPRLNGAILREGEEEEEDKMLRVYLAQDKKNNLLMVSGYFNPWVFPEPTLHRQAFLIDQQGNIRDYKVIIPKMSNAYRYDLKHDGNYFSSDFQYEVGSTAMGDGLTFWELQQDLEIEAFHKNPAYQHSFINSIDSISLLINSNQQVSRFNLLTGRSERLTRGDFLRARAFSSFAYKDDRIWMSADIYQKRRVGLQWYDPATNETDHIPIDIKFEKFVFLNSTEVALFKDNGDFDDIGDLYIFDMESRTKRPFLYKNAPFSIGAKINDLLFLEDSLLWVGAQNGLWQIDFSNNEIRHFIQPEYLKNKNILCIHQEDDGTLWLGTGKSGILLFNPKTNNIRQISDANGLANNTVVGILADDQMNHWVSTFNGITVLNPEEKVLAEITEAEGLISNKFYQQSFYKLPDGRMIFGGYAGLIMLQPDHVLQTVARKKINKIYLTGLEYYDSERNGNASNQGSYYSAKPIQIPARHRYLHLDFALSEYVNLNDHTFSYRLLPLDHSYEQAASISWINLGAASQVTINNIPAGAYIVQVRGSDSRSNQVVAPLEISIEVRAFFYLTWWFYLLCAISIVLGVWFWIRRIKTEKERLEVEVDRRTTQIQKDKALIERQAVQLQELDQAKSRFFTNISHEFRTPLTVILGMVEQNKNPERVRKLIRRNARHLLELVNQILNLRKLESGRLPTQFVQADVVAYLNYIIESFQSLAEDKEITLKFETIDQQLVLDYDPEKLRYIVSNLLTNAIKYTPVGGVVKIALEAQANREAPVYQFSVSDTGVGIPAKKLPHIFDRFYQVDDDPDSYRESRTGDGTGIGLTLVRELVKLLNGHISVESEPCQGTTFKVQLPFTNQAELEKGIPGATNPDNMPTDTWSVDPMPHSNHGLKDLPTLLIVEDNPDVMEYLVTCLKEEYQLLFARDGLEGLEKTMEKIPDIIISDVMMPKVDGFTLCNTLKKRPADQSYPHRIADGQGRSGLPDNRFTARRRCLSG